jgi:hypothetical protein
MGCAFALSLLVAPSHAQQTACSTDTSGSVETCVANVLRIPAADPLACMRRQESEAAADSQRAADKQDKAAARARVAEARMEDAEQADPPIHTDLEESFDAARSRVAEDKREPRVSETSSACTHSRLNAAPTSGQDTVEITFDAPDHCLESLLRSLQGNLPIAVQIVGQQDLREATARLINVATFIQHGSSSARARAALSNPTGLVLDDDTVVVRLQCR